MPVRRPVTGLLAGVLVAAAPSAAAATSATAADSGVVGLPRYPAVSPDGSQVVFSWAGDLWRVSTTGGRATRLTSHPGDDLRSVWSPDGEAIAFVSTRDGYGNIWRMNPDGTGIRRVTDLDRTLALSDWATVGGQERILFSAVMETDVYREARPYHVSPEGGPVARLHDAFGSHPVASPDGDRVAFARGGYFDGWERRHYRGAENQDVWLVDADGEGFRAMTTWEGNDGKARWLDDDTLLYLSDRADRVVALYSRDVSAAESRARRLADFGQRDIHDWSVSRDGSTAILMSWDGLYRLDLRRRGAQPQRLEITANQDARDNQAVIAVGRNVSDAALSPDGAMMAMVAYGEIFVRPVKDGPARRVTTSHAREKDLAWSPDGLKLYFTSDRDGTESIYAATVARTRGEIRDAFASTTGIELAFDPAASDAKADAKADDGGDPPAADPPAAPADLVTGTWSGTVDVPEMGPMPFTMTLELGPDGLVSGSIDVSGAAGGSVRGTFNEATGDVSLTVTVDEGPSVTVTGTISGSTLSATATMNGAEFAFEATRAGEPAVADAPDPEPAPAADDGADDEGEADDDPALDPKRWQDAIEFTITPVVARLSNDREATPSPDGRHLLFRGIRGNLHRLDLDSGDITTVLEHWDRGVSAEWSPDGRFLAYAVSDLNFNRDIWITAIDGSLPPINITRHPDNDSTPSWSADGRLMSFVSERVNEENDIWFVALDEDFEALRGPELEAYWERSKKAAKARKPLEPGTMADVPTTEPPFDAAELETAYLRLRRITRLEGNEGQPRITPDGERIVFSASGLASGLHSVKWDGSGRTSLGGGGRILGMNLTGTKVVVVSGGQAQTLSPTGGGSRTTIAFRDELRIDLAAQSSQKFMEASRALGEGFYHPDMHGVNWSRTTRAWHELALGARTADEFNWVANRFIGELNASHMGIRAPGDTSSPLRESRGRLGVTTVRVDDGFRVTSIMKDAPADQGPMRLEIGDVITGVEGREAGPTDSLAGLLRGRSGKETIVSVRRTMDGTSMDLELLLTPTSYGAIRRLGYDAWVQRRKDLVHEWSDGRLGYIHIQGMNQPSLDVFERDLFAAADGRDGLVLDVRNNGGGWTTDRVLSSIMVQSHSYTVPRGAKWGTGERHYPQDRLFIQRYMMPMNLLCNEKSYSNAEIISHAFKTLERGTLVGQTTHGSVISTGGTSLIDGTSVRMPFRGWFVDDGTDRDMELNGAEPDLVVPQTPEDEVRGEDAQLRAAVQDLLQRLDG